MYIVIVIVGLLVSWLFSISATNARLKFYKAEKDTLKRILYASGVISPYKRLFEFLFDCFLFDFAYRNHYVLENGLSMAFLQNISFVAYYLYCISPIRTNLYFYYATKSLVPLLVLLYSLAFSRALYRKNAHRGYAILYVIPVIAVWYLILFVFSVIIAFLGGWIGIEWLFMSVKIIISIFLIFVSIAVLDAVYHM